ncbi:unnamed protein product [Durusdinium trenchii]|uniref:Uncharacterized protein n=1 Tax=Durusdinium trenchii TaxID=1381693 RepID=A0ABP0SLY3_9DINO
MVQTSHWTSPCFCQGLFALRRSFVRRPSAPNPPDPERRDPAPRSWVQGRAGHAEDTLCRMASRIRLEDADWRAFRRDILDLTSPELSVAEKLHVIATMRHTYHVFDLRL